eukprot:7301893-Ditylum_brightwellii.AAC.1
MKKQDQTNILYELYSRSTKTRTPSGNFGFSIEALPASVIDVSKKVAMTNNEEEMLDFITVFVLVMCCSSCCCFRENLWDEQIWADIGQCQAQDFRRHESS